MKIIKFENKYRDDLIFMVLEAKNALGLIPGLNMDLLDIKSNYFDKGDMFWIAVDECDRVVGSIGFNSDNTNGVTLHRLFVKYSMKRQGIGTELLKTAEDYVKKLGKEAIYVNLGVGEKWFESRIFYSKHGYTEYQPNRMKKTLKKMKHVLNLQDLIDQMDIQFDECDTYIDKETMCLISIMDDKIYGTEDIIDYDEFEELYGDRFIAIPNKYDINEYSIMEDFIETLPDSLQHDFYYAINGKGAFRRFKNLAIRKNVEKQWYEFKEQKLKQIAIEWCLDNDIEYED
ncbi:MAG: UPF0158 family protein [bacterium]|nr:UPF0158 family protein [bacterium]